MRDLNECQAEVFRRSEKRIKERTRRRKQFLMTCIPMVLCIGVFGAYMLSEMLPTTDRYIVPETSNEQNIFDPAIDCATNLPTGTVEVSGNGISHSYSSNRDVQQIMDLINDIVVNAEVNYDESHRGASGNESLISDASEERTNISYKILVRSGDGSDTEYLLIGNMLIHQSTQEKFQMNETTCFALKDALGIPY